MLVETAVFAAVAALMGVSTVAFVAFSLLGDHENRYFLLPPAIMSIAGLSYAGMAASSGGFALEGLVLELRYLDWLLTTPLIVMHIAVVAAASRKTIAAAMGADALMIAAGYAATTAATPGVKWGGFAVSTVAFLAVVYLLLTTVTDGVRDETAAVQGTFRTLRDLTIALWLVYPVIWLLSPSGFGVITAPDYHFIIAVLDTTAKVGFTSIVTFSITRVGDLFAEAETTATATTA
ncbi:bacteriorhodopsin [Halorubrum yunnanense]|uniref:Bacteriorhodopsin n=1 Tax=Halorubrum yunnanense TaxID=1526162 RepID=A0ABD5YCZ6_9EURY|nr:bacteriorhodopsin [Halorubrum yunnanense]